MFTVAFMVAFTIQLADGQISYRVWEGYRFQSEVGCYLASKLILKEIAKENDIQEAGCMSIMIRDNEYIPMFEPKLDRYIPTS